ncbi:MAG: zinc-ribbon domain-containing protein [Acholeplasmatales bacterium]|jgi:DNA-directed RNA polymerase subunit RPC12/RpoP|nr:zinc-ribbon domain-containing protein [Acholeplasmatales bacterium]
MKAKFCVKCGEKIEEDQQFCVKCGQKISEIGEKPANEQDNSLNKTYKPEGSQAVLGFVFSIVALICIVLNQIGRNFTFLIFSAFIISCGFAIAGLALSIANLAKTKNPRSLALAGIIISGLALLIIFSSLFLRDTF